LTLSWILQTLYELEDGGAGPRLVGELLPVEQFAFERRKDALSHGVVIGVADRAHRRSDFGFLAPQSEGDRSVLRSLIGMVDHVLRLALRDGDIEGIEDQLGREVVAHCPADDVLRARIEHDG
jgi:hypothetical protein